MQGLATIRAFRAVSRSILYIIKLIFNLFISNNKINYFILILCYLIFRFERENEDILENYLKAELSSNLASLWFDFRLKIIGLIVLFLIGLISVFIHQWNLTNAGL